MLSPEELFNFKRQSVPKPSPLPVNDYLKIPAPAAETLGDKLKKPKVKAGLGGIALGVDLVGAASDALADWGLNKLGYGDATVSPDTTFNKMLAKATAEKKAKQIAGTTSEQRDSLYGRTLPDGATLQRLKLGRGLTPVVDRATIEKHMAEGGIIPGSRNEGWRKAEAAKAQAVIDKRNAEIAAQNNSIFGYSVQDLVAMATAKPKPGMKFSEEIQLIRDQKWAKGLLRMHNDNQNAALDREDRRRRVEVLSQKYGADAAANMLKAEKAARKDKLKEIKDRLPDSKSYNEFLTLVGMSPAAIRKAGFNPLLKDMDQMDTSVLLDAYLKAQDQAMNMTTTKTPDLWFESFRDIPTYESVLRNAYLSNLGGQPATQ